MKRRLHSSPVKEVAYWGMEVIVQNCYADNIYNFPHGNNEVDSSPRVGRHTDSENTLAAGYFTCGNQNAGTNSQPLLPKKLSSIKLNYN